MIILRLDIELRPISEMGRWCRLSIIKQFAQDLGFPM